MRCRYTLILLTFSAAASGASSTAAEQCAVRCDDGSRCSLSAAVDASAASDGASASAVLQLRTRSTQAIANGELSESRLPSARVRAVLAEGQRLRGQDAALDELMDALAQARGADTMQSSLEQIERWNQRHPDPQLQAALEPLQCSCSGPAGQRAVCKS